MKKTPEPAIDTDPEDGISKEEFAKRFAQAAQLLGISRKDKDGNTVPMTEEYCLDLMKNVK